MVPYTKMHALTYDFQFNFIGCVTINLLLLTFYCRIFFQQLESSINSAEIEGDQVQVKHFNLTLISFIFLFF